MFGKLLKLGAPAPESQINITIDQSKEIELEMPEKTSEHYKQPTLEEKARDYMDVIEAGITDCHHEMKYLRCLYLKLIEKDRLKPQYRELLKDLEEFMMQHDGRDPNMKPVLNAEDMHKWADYDDDDDD